MCLNPCPVFVDHYIGRIEVDHLLLKSISQDSGSVLFYPHTDFKVTECFNLLDWNQQITCIQLTDIFVADIRKQVSFKTSPDRALIIF